MRLRDYAPSQRSCTFGIENQTRFRLTARLHDGHLAWRGWFDDRDDADAFLNALARHLLMREPMPREIVKLIAPECLPWSAELTERGVRYRFECVTFLTANAGSLQEWRVPEDWRDPLQAPGHSPFEELFFFSSSPAYLTATSNTSETIASNWSATNYVEAIGGGASGCGPFQSGGGGGGGGSYAKSVNLTGLTPGGSATYVAGAGKTGSTTNGTAGGDSWFNDTAFPSSGQKVGAKGGLAGTGSTGGAAGNTANSYATGTGNTKYAGGAAGSSSENCGGGGGGAAGPAGAGATGGGTGTNGGGGGGGGGSGGGTAGSAGVGSGGNGGAGGNNSNGVGGGATTSGAANNGSSSAGYGAGGGSGGANNNNGGTGGNGQEWDSTHGSGGGAGGPAASTGITSKTGATGGTYGGGASGGGATGATSQATGGNSAQGIVVVTYTPVSTIALFGRTLPI